MATSSPLLERQFLEKLERLTIHWQKSFKAGTTVRVSPAVARNFWTIAISIMVTTFAR